MKVYVVHECHTLAETSEIHGVYLDETVARAAYKKLESQPWGPDIYFTEAEVDA